MKQIRNNIFFIKKLMLLLAEKTNTVCSCSESIGFTRLGWATSFLVEAASSFLSSPWLLVAGLLVYSL